MREESKELLLRIFRGEIVKLDDMIKRLEAKVKEEGDGYTVHEFVIATVDEYTRNLGMMNATMKKYKSLQYREIVWRKKLDEITSMTTDAREPTEV